MRIKIILFVSCFITQCYAQQEAQYTMFWNNYSLYNPAATGLFNKHFASLNARHQWKHFVNAPKTISAVYDFKWAKINSGIGINYVFDQLGFEKNNRIELNYSYHFRLKNNRVLSSGVSIGALRKSIDFSKFAPLDPTDPLLTSGSIKTDDYFNINFGLMFKTPHFLLGLSTTQITYPSSKIFNPKISRHYYFSGMFNTSVGKNFDLKPGMFVKSDFANTQFDFNVRTLYKKRYWAGISYRITDAICFMAGVDIKGKYRVGYSYDHTISVIGDFSKGSHEIVLVFMAD